MELSEDLHLVGPGEQLKEARQQQGLTIEDVAGRLKLRPALITQIEQEQFDGIPNQTFLRGYLSSYARLLGLPEHQILQALQNLGIAKTQEAEMRSYSKRHKTQSQNSKLMLASYLVCAGLIASLLVWWLQEGEQAQLFILGEKPTPTVVQPLDPQPEALEPELPEQPAAPESEPTMAEVPVTTEVATQPPAEDTLPAQPAQQPAEETFVTDPTITASTTTAAVTETPAPAEETAAAGSEAPAAEAGQQLAGEPLLPEASPTVDVTDRLQIEFVGDCWIQVKDATGRNLIAGIRNNSSPVDVSGTPPYRLVIGAPEQLKELRFEGEAIELADFPAGKVVRITLPQ